VLEGRAGGDVIGCDIVDVAVLSLQPQNKPGVLHSTVVVEEGGMVVVGSLHPPQKPGDWQDVVGAEKLFVEVGVNAPLVLVVVVVVLS